MLARRLVLLRLTLLLCCAGCVAHGCGRVGRQLFRELILMETVSSVDAMSRTALIELARRLALPPPPAFAQVLPLSLSLSLSLSLPLPLSLPLSLSLLLSQSLPVAVSLPLSHSLIAFPLSHVLLSCPAPNGLCCHALCCCTVLCLRGQVALHRDGEGEGEGEGEKDGKGGTEGDREEDGAGQLTQAWRRPQQFLRMRVQGVLDHGRAARLTREGGRCCYRR